MNNIKLVEQMKYEITDESDCSALRKRIVELEEGLRQIAVWKQEDQDDHKTCILQWRGCVAIARQLLKPNKKISQKEMGDETV